ncbi:hypothetical protein QMO56_23910 [Roseomonas sp. E05]|uniref:hypothetical protein n=1 Tax=Roseomonas sp. E05 TaxID=3046310 RepID=UPI0024BAC5F3|nr:hypothetical protein [Roseomonas sp. E05]MDJ0391161.1 hypothetical protein [Roseomonas sp. E05]
MSNPGLALFPDGREFFRVLIKAEKDDMDVDLAEQDMVEAAQRLVARHPEVGAIVLECANMPPYTAAVQRTTGGVARRLG